MDLLRLPVFAELTRASDLTQSNQRATAALEAAKTVLDQAQAHALLADLCAAVGDADNATEHRKAAQTLSERLGTPLRVLSAARGDASATVRESAG